MHLKFFPKKKRENNIVNDNVIDEENKFNTLIVLDNVSGLADRSNNFSNFSTVARKFNFTCVYVFHTIYLSNLTGR